MINNSAAKSKAYRYLLGLMSSGGILVGTLFNNVSIEFELEFWDLKLKLEIPIPVLVSWAFTSATFTPLGRITVDKTMDALSQGLEKSENHNNNRKLQK